MLRFCRVEVALRLGSGQILVDTGNPDLRLLAGVSFDKLFQPLQVIRVSILVGQDLIDPFFDTLLRLRCGRGY
ncbi:hypothetical protein TH66_12285 [Carbonactinospora thermoautotrophica]|nr:hypothetical protein TH66_12285 [Carbonactinospora thermoautotrophica]